jgi:hypothetical protein
MSVASLPVITAAWRQKPSNEGTCRSVCVEEGTRGKLVAEDSKIACQGAYAVCAPTSGALACHG